MTPIPLQLARHLLRLVCAAGTLVSLAPHAAAASLKCRIEVSRFSILPYESLGVLVTVTNDSLDKIVATNSWGPGLRVAPETKADVTWIEYHGDLEPLIRPTPAEPREFAAGDRMVYTIWLYYQGGRHVFAAPGNYQLSASVGGIQSAPVTITVQQPTGFDSGAFEFLRDSDKHFLPRYFSEWTVDRFHLSDVGKITAAGQRLARDPNYPYAYDSAVPAALESFVSGYDGSRYADLARLGLAAIWMRGVEGKPDLAKAKKLLTQLAARTGQPVAYEANYSLGKLNELSNDSLLAARYYDRALTLGADAVFRSLVERSRQDLGFPSLAGIIRKEFEKAGYKYYEYELGKDWLEKFETEVSAVIQKDFAAGKVTVDQLESVYSLRTKEWIDKNGAPKVESVP